MSDAWREGTPPPPSSQGSEQPPPMTEAPGTSPSAEPGELAGLVTPTPPPPPPLAPPVPNQLSGAAMPAAPTAPPKKAPVWQGLAIRVGIIAVIVIAGLVLRDRLSGNASDLRVGDCFDVPTSASNEVSDVQHQPCTDPHDGEVFFVGDYPTQATHPSLEDFRGFATTNCVPAFESYIGRDYETDTEFDFGAFYPTSESWSSGDHEVTCHAVLIDGSKLSKSVKNAGPAAS